MTSNNFVDRLVDDLQPRASLSATYLWLWAGLGFTLFLALLLVTIGIRDDAAAALQSGVMVWKPGLFFLGWIGSLLWIRDAAYPDRKVRIRYALPFLLASLALLTAFLMGVSDLSMEYIRQVLADPASAACLLAVGGGGSLAMAVLWRVWLAKTAPMHPMWLGALAGINAGCLAATVYALHCDRDAPFYILIFYGVPLTGLSLVGAYLGQRLLRW